MSFRHLSLFNYLTVSYIFEGLDYHLLGPCLGKIPLKAFGYSPTLATDGASVDYHLLRLCFGKSINSGVAGYSTIYLPYTPSQCYVGYMLSHSIEYE